MKIIIVGGGKIGITLAEQLSVEGHDITLIDSQSLPLQQASELLDVLCIQGDGTAAEDLLEAGVDKADLLIAVTLSDELNLLSCLLGKKLGAKNTIARVRKPEFDRELSLISRDMGLSISVNPELICAKEMARSLRTASAIKVDTFSGGRVELLQVELPETSPLAGKTLMELPTLGSAKVLLGAVERDDQAVIPTGAFRLAAGDRISLLASPGQAHAFLKEMHLVTTPVRSAMLIGGSKLSYYLAKQLLELGMAVTILEKDYDRCEDLSELLPKATILHGDGTNEKVLCESGLPNMDACAVLTGIDEENLLISMYVRSTFPHIKVLTKTNRQSFRHIINVLDVGSRFNPRQSAANLICRYVRAMENSQGSTVETLYKLLDGKVEALEFRVAAGEDFCGIPLMKLPLKKNLLIGAILRGGRVIIPGGADTIEEGDRVVVITTIQGMSQMDDIFDR